MHCEGFHKPLLSDTQLRDTVRHIKCRTVGKAPRREVTRPDKQRNSLRKTFALRPLMVHEGANLDKVTFICNLIVLPINAMFSSALRPLRTAWKRKISVIYVTFTALTYISCVSWTITLFYLPVTCHRYPISIPFKLLHCPFSLSSMNTIPSKLTVPVPPFTRPTVNWISSYPCSADIRGIRK